MEGETERWIKVDQVGPKVGATMFWEAHCSEGPGWLGRVGQWGAGDDSMFPG